MMRFLVSVSRLPARRCSIPTHAEGPGSDVEIAMIDSLAFQPALGWYQVPFWLGDVCPRGRRHDVLNRRILILFLGSVELTRGVRPREA